MLYCSYIPITVFFIGIISIAYNSHNIIRILIGVELCLLAANWNFMIGYLHYNLADGPSYVLVVLALAGAEVAVGFGLIVLGYRRTGSIDLKKFAVLRDGAKEFDERYGVLTLNTNVSKSN